MKWVYAALAAFVLGMALFWPRVFMVVDEERYVSQALAFSQGTASIEGASLLHLAPKHRTISDYPPGTSLVQTPFVWLFGWRGAALTSLLSLMAATLLVARWLRDEGLKPAFALYIPGFIGSAMFGRFAMSDLPSAALVALFCLALWRAERSSRMSLVAGLCFGAMPLFREPPVLIMAPLLVGAAVRRRVHIPAAAAGVAGGLALRLVGSALLFGTPFYIRDPGVGFSLSSLGHSVPIFGIVLLVPIPGAALLPFLYRGPRRAELTAAFAFYVALILLLDFDSVRMSGLVKGPLHISRYICPLLPIIAYMGAQVWPRIFRRDARAVQGTPVLARALAVGAIVIAFTVHPVINRQEGSALAIVRSIIGHTQSAAPVITNIDATLKYLSPTYDARMLIPRYGLTVDSVRMFASAHGPLTLVFLDRRDSEHFRRDASDNERFIADIRQRCDVREMLRENIETWADLRILQLESCR